jgi:hypothetical protein
MSQSRSVIYKLNTDNRRLSCKDGLVIEGRDGCSRAVEQFSANLVVFVGIFETEDFNQLFLNLDGMVFYRAEQLFLLYFIKLLG